MTTTGKFSKASFDLLEEFEVNNDREWFLENKDAYSSLVQAPFAEVLQEVSRQLVKTKVPFSGSSKTMFRVNRDVRFSKDKSPYSTHVSGLLTRSGTKSEAGALIYVQLSAGGGFIIAGTYHPQTPRLNEIRDAMIEHPKKLKLVIESLSKAQLDLDTSEAVKTMPRGYSEFADLEIANVLKLKNLMVRKDFERKQWLSANISSELAQFAISCGSLIEFLEKN